MREDLRQKNLPRKGTKKHEKEEEEEEKNLPRRNTEFHTEFHGVGREEFLPHAK